MTWQQYWLHQEQSRREQTLALESELRELTAIDPLFQKLERRAKRALRRYLRASVRRATGRILRHHPDGIFRSFSIARRLRRFVLKQCRVRMEIWIGSSGDLEYPELVDTLPALSANSHEARARNLDLARAHNLAPFLAIDYGSNFGALLIYPAQGTMPAYTRVNCSLPDPRKDGKVCQALPIYSEALAGCSALLTPTMEEFRQVVEREQRRRTVEAKIRQMNFRRKQSSVAQEAWMKVCLPETKKLELMRQADLFLDGIAKCPQAVLLHGPPGTGKTLLATTLAEVMGGCHFFRPTLAQLKCPSLGQSAQRVAELWKEVRSNKPAILFLDECDCLLGKRGAAETDAIGMKLVQAFLSEWNGKEEGVWLIGATNRRDRLDGAILSRFATEMEIALPEGAARVEIFQKEMTALRVSGKIPADIGARTVGMSGRNLAMLASKVVAAAYPGEVEARHFYSALQSLRAAGNTQVDEEATWRTLILPQETEEKLRALCALLGNVEAWKARGVSIPTGLLLVGPPGVGKTQIARTLANESGLSFVAATTADLKANFLGQSGNRVKELFGRARASAPGILFLDEIDILTRDRAVSGNDPLLQEVIGQLLQEIDGIRRSTAHVFLLAATNHAGHVDAAIRSRLQEQIEIPLPDLEARVRLLKIFLRSKPVNFPLAGASRSLAQQTEGMSGRDLHNWVARAEHKAVQRAIVRGGPLHFTLTLDDFN